MHPVLQQVFDAYGPALAQQSEEWCQRHPRQDERQWSAQELIEHLVLTCRSTTRELEKRLERGHPTRARRTPMQSLMQLVVLSFGQMPNGVPAPIFARPDQLHWSATGGTELLEMLRQEMERMDDRITQCRQRFGIQRVASHFLLGPLRPDQWRRFHAIHIRHHLDQMKRIARAVDDPASPGASPVAREHRPPPRISSST
jgi:DinB superfamily